MSTILTTLLRYQSWANSAFFDALQVMDKDRHAAEYQQSMGLMSHIHVVAEIFAAHLTGRAHGYQSDNADEIPALSALRASVAASDLWYLDYAMNITPSQLAETVAFGFTDGDKGYMSREEMMTHVVLHGAYHRGETGRILMRQAIGAPWDTFAVYLHQREPQRRRQGGLEFMSL